MKIRGFSLLELLITLVVLSLLLTVTLPSFKQQVQRSRILSETDDFRQGILLARTRAISLNQRVTMAHRGTWSSGWDIFVDSNHNGKADEGELIILSLDKELAVNIKGNSAVEDYVSFVATGQSLKATGKAKGAFQAGTFTICLEQEKGVQLVLSRGGRVRTINDVTVSC